MQQRFLQLIDREGDHVIFEDKDTKERFPVSVDKENLPNKAPWLSKFGMIEEFDGYYYFNGFWMGVDPGQLDKARETDADIMTDKSFNIEEVIELYFLYMILSV